MTELRVEILDDAAKVAAIREPWAELFDRASQWSVAQGPDYVMTAWDIISRQSDVSLAVIAVWAGTSLICIWPLHVRRSGGVRVACHPGCGGHEEYAGPLIAGEDETARAAGRLALDAAKGLADVLRVYNVRAPSIAAEILAADRSPRRNASVQSPTIDLKAFADGDTWVQSLSKKLRAEVRHDRRHLSAKGELKFQEMSGPVDGPRCIDWIFKEKRSWLAGRGIKKSWMLEAQGRDLFAALAARPRGDRPLRGDVQTYALTLDGAIIAAGFGFSSSDRWESYNNAYDISLNDYSPGSLLIEDCVRLAIGARLDYDFRITLETYKKRWFDRLDRYDSFMIACTRAGQVSVALEKVERRVRVFRAKWGPRVKGLLRRRRGGAR